MKLLKIIVLVLCSLLLATSAYAAQRNLAVTSSNAQSQKRVALVIGNAAYKGTAALRNPVNDAKAMSNALNRLGFEVIEVTDATQKEMLRAVTAFGSKLNAETAALFFYAGHGMQVRGKNYIIPVDAQIETEAAVASESVSVDTVLEQLNVSTVSIVILDACRNNPFERSFRKMGGGGLAQMDAPKGSFIAYATAPGKTAADGDGKNGLFTQELLRQIKESGLTLETVFKRVRANVSAKSGDAQMPWDSSSMTGEFYFKPPASTLDASTEPIPVHIKTGEEIEQETWEAAKDSKSEAAIRAYMKEYPSGRYISQARVLMATLGPEITSVKITNSGLLVAPGNRRHSYALTPIDARQFSKGTIKIEISIGGGESSGSFDLFADGMPIPKTGSTRSLAHSYDMSPGASATITYSFNNGQLFLLGAEGNWFSPEGATNNYSFVAIISGELK